MHLTCPVSFLGNNRQLLSVCATMSSSLVRKVLSTTEANMFLGTLNGVWYPQL